MKFFLVAAILTTGLSFNADAGGTLFPGVCQTTYPLATSDRCDLESNIGYGVYLCALNNATLDCKAAQSADCIELALPKYEVIGSSEFPGYRACRATVTVRGWKRD